MNKILLNTIALSSIALNFIALNGVGSASKKTIIPPSGDVGYLDSGLLDTFILS